MNALLTSVFSKVKPTVICIELSVVKQILHSYVTFPMAPKSVLNGVPADDPIISFWLLKPIFGGFCRHGSASRHSTLYDKIRTDMAAGLWCYLTVCSIKHAITCRPTHVGTKYWQQMHCSVDL